MRRRIRRRIKPKLRLIALPGNQGQGSSKLNAEQLLARREEAMRLRLEEKLSYREIGERLGIDYATAHKDVQIIKEMKLAGMIEKDSMVLLENNHTYDEILSVWMPLLKPLMRGELLVGETKVRQNGSDYDVLMPTFEAAKTATEMILKAAGQRERLNGYSGSGDTKKTSPEVIEDSAKLIFELMRGFASKQTIKAEIIEPEALENGQPD